MATINPKSLGRSETEAKVQATLKESNIPSYTPFENTPGNKPLFSITTGKPDFSNATEMNPSAIYANSNAAPMEELAADLSEATAEDFVAIPKSSPNWKALSKAFLWLKSLEDKPSVHAKNLILGAALLGTNSVTGIHRFGFLGKGASKAVAAIGMATATASFTNSRTSTAIFKELNAILDEFKNPCIEGIPIHAEKELQSQDVVVATNLYMRSSQSANTHVADNAVPKLKTWQLSGYLMFNPLLSPQEANLIIKPSLLAQRKLLQYYIDTRMPVMFKTHDNRFYKVIISHFDSEYVTQARNALKVNLTLTEYVVMEIQSEAGAKITMALGGAQI